MDLWSWSCRYLEMVLLSVTETTCSPTSRGIIISPSGVVGDDVKLLIQNMNVIIKKFFFFKELSLYIHFCSTLPNYDGKWEFHWICRRDLSTRWTSSLEKCGTIGGGHGRFPSFTQQSKGQSHTVSTTYWYLSTRPLTIHKCLSPTKVSEETLCVSMLSFPTLAFDRPKNFFYFLWFKNSFSSHLSSLWPISSLLGVLNTKLLNKSILDGLLSYLCSSSTGGWIEKGGGGNQS